jgi:hypothetical protein
MPKLHPATPRSASRGVGKERKLFVQSVPLDSDNPVSKEGRHSEQSRPRVKSRQNETIHMTYMKRSHHPPAWIFSSTDDASLTISPTKL